MQQLGVVDDRDRELILSAARDYIESWFDGDPVRMASCLHPDLVKREIEPDPGHEARVDTMSRADMVDATEEGYGRRHERTYDIDVLDTFGDISAVRVLSSTYVDYLHVARIGERWLLINVLWKRRPGA